MRGGLSYREPIALASLANLCKRPYLSRITGAFPLWPRIRSIDGKAKLKTQFKNKKMEDTFRIKQPDGALLFLSMQEFSAFCKEFSIDNKSIEIEGEPESTSAPFWAKQTEKVHTVAAYGFDMLYMIDLTALHTDFKMNIAEFLEKTYNSNQYELRPTIVCADGFEMSVQASEFHYCTPRVDGKVYSTVEIGFPNNKEELIMPFAEEPENPTGTVYGYVDTEIVDAVIKKHGGLDQKFVSSLFL